MHALFQIPDPKAPMCRSKVGIQLDGLLQLLNVLISFPRKPITHCQTCIDDGHERIETNRGLERLEAFLGAPYHSEIEAEPLMTCGIPREASRRKTAIRLDPF